MGIDLPLVWAGIIVFGLMMYVVMDGFDLGIGMLFPFFQADRDRDTMMNTIAPVWDGNETWLVLGGAGLLAAFPMVYSIFLSALHIPLILMLMGLIFRGVAFEFRFKNRDDPRRLWDKAFAGGSSVATFCQGVVLGTYIDGLPLKDGVYAGGAFAWIAPFPLFTGVALVAAYALLGATWLIMKTEGDLQRRMRQLARPLALVLLLAIATVSLWTPLAHDAIAARWFTWPGLVAFLPVPVLVVVAAIWLFKSLRGKSHAAPFVLTLALLFLGYSGLCISTWPYAIPPDLTIWQAAGPPQSLGFTLVGALVIVPVILMYTAFAYWVFRGKVTEGHGYH